MASITNYYFGYGSNLSKEQMAIRCPESKYYASGTLSGYSWLINARGYASITPSESEFVLGEVFTLSQQDIDYLDIYESVEEGMYLRKMDRAHQPWPQEDKNPRSTREPCMELVRHCWVCWRTPHRSRTWSTFNMYRQFFSGVILNV